MEHNGQHFEYIIIIDFEATCDQGEKPAVTRENQEIIEFPWVVLNTKNLHIVDEGQIYCKPEWTLELTEFCTKLTGITNETIKEKGILLKDAIIQFDNYIETNLQGRLFCILTDGDWDIKTCLLRETKKKNIEIADHYYRYLNLKSIFLNATADPDVRSKLFTEKTLPANVTVPLRPSLGFMLSALQLEFEGHQHSGIDDCKNIAKVVVQLMKNGVFMNDYVNIPRDFNPSEETVRDFNVTKNQLNDPSEMSLVPTTVIRLRGIPFRATKQDIISFLGVPLTEDKVHILKNIWNKPSGAALVKFNSIEEAEKAMEKDKQYMGARFIELHYRKCDSLGESDDWNTVASKKVY